MVDRPRFPGPQSGASACMVSGLWARWADAGTPGAGRAGSWILRKARWRVSGLARLSAWLRLQRGVIVDWCFCQRQTLLTR